MTELEQLIHCHHKVLLAELTSLYVLDAALLVMTTVVVILNVFRNTELQQLLPIQQEDALENKVER